MSNDTLPEIRFPEFTDEWEQVKLKDVATVFDGTHQTPKYTESGVKFVSVENIKTLETEKYISQEAYDSEYSKKQAEKGDVLMTRIGDIGTAKVIETDEPLAYYVTLALLKPNEIDSSFLAWLISSPEVQRNIWKRTLHIAFPKKINLGEINQIEMNVPSLEEQTKIGTFFKQIDNTITLHQRKLDLLKETKKGFLQKMFPKNGAKVPEIRFPGFTEDWEQRKLGELATIVRGASPRPIQDPKWFDTESDVGWLRIADVTEQDGRIYYLEQHISKLGQEKTRVLVEPHLLLSIAATVGKPVVNYVKTGVHDGFLIFLNAIFDREFMFQWLEMFRPKWQKYGQPGSQVNLNSELVRNQEILIPNNEEQQKIGSFFKQLDDTIALHQRELDVLKETKKGFLQKMFV
ncbi:restriction endonuclease subunit S [Enterococcus faecium]|uniref:restriction endonuclease subunit S n=1 Tax=Enterococcus faecium TaxID=1352 RepID=UPI0022EBC2E6|nr:restriction endonuclease subunit S [Enterococcus faecium]